MRLNAWSESAPPTREHGIPLWNVGLELFLQLWQNVGGYLLKNTISFISQLPLEMLLFLDNYIIFWFKPLYMFLYSSFVSWSLSLYFHPNMPAICFL